ncbi:hypothetical protein HAX54_044101, partial [Datura stramonium]|nr:hypothetical protein [Datura stramonium]
SIEKKVVEEEEEVHANIPHIEETIVSQAYKKKDEEEVVEEMASFAKYLEDLVTKQRIVKDEVVTITHRVNDE